MIQSAVSRAITAWLGRPPSPRIRAAIRSPGGPDLEMEVFDLLKGSEAQVEALRADSLVLHRGCFEAGLNVDADQRDARLVAHIEEAFNTDRYDHFNLTVMIRSNEAPIAAVHAHVSLAQVAGHLVEVLRVGGTVLQAHRGNKLLNRCFNRAVAEYARNHLITRVPRYYVGLCMTPLTYYFTMRRARCMFPNPEETAPPEMLAIYQEMFGDRVNEDHIMPEVVGSNETPETSAWLHRMREDPYVSYYLAKNPDYQLGFTMPIIIGLAPADFLYSVAQVVKLDSRAQLRRVLGTSRSA